MKREREKKDRLQMRKLERDRGDIYGLWRAHSLGLPEASLLFSDAYTPMKNFKRPQSDKNVGMVLKKRGGGENERGDLDKLITKTNFLPLSWGLNL